jgi:hypothetical protein
VVTYIITINSSLAALMDSLIPIPACSFQTKRGASWSFEMLRFRRYRRAGGKVLVLVAWNQELIVRKVKTKRGRITRNSCLFCGLGRVGTSKFRFLGVEDESGLKPLVSSVY